MGNKRQLDQRLAALARRQYGVVSRDDALRLGLTAEAVRRRVRSRRWEEVYPRVYQAAGCPPSLENRVLAAVFAAGPHAVASHRSAAALWRLRGVVAAEPEVVVPYPKCPRVPGVRSYRSRTLRPEDVTMLGTIRLTTPTRTMLDLSGVLDLASLEDALDDALQRRLVNSRKLEIRFAGAQHGVPGVDGLRGLLALRVRGHLGESRFENRLRRVLVAGGLPVPTAQYVVRDTDGSFAARVDLAYPRARLAIEADGYAFHSGRRAFERDRERQNRLINAGWRVLRVTPSQLDSDPAGLTAAVKRALGASVRRKRR
ncbi:MAG: endonuclease domain-containing protein [Actinomycetota bacterium]